MNVKSVKYENNTTIFDNGDNSIELLKLAEDAQTFIEVNNELYQIIENEDDETFYINK